MPGVRLLSGRYRLGEVLGHGGMAEVYRARDTRLERDVAIKVLRSDLARDAELPGPLQPGGAKCGRGSRTHPTDRRGVRHRLRTRATSPPLPYIVMEYVPGQTLREVLQTGGRLTPARAHRDRHARGL